MELQKNQFKIFDLSPMRKNKNIFDKFKSKTERREIPKLNTIKIKNNNKNFKIERVEEKKKDNENENFCHNKKYINIFQNEISEKFRKILKRNTFKSEKRSPVYEKNKFFKNIEIYLMLKKKNLNKILKPKKMNSEKIEILNKNPKIKKIKKSIILNEKIDHQTKIEEIAKIPNVFFSFKLEHIKNNFCDFYENRTTKMKKVEKSPTNINIIKNNDILPILSHRLEKNKENIISTKNEIKKIVLTQIEEKMEKSQKDIFSKKTIKKTQKKETLFDKQKLLPDLQKKTKKKEKKEKTITKKRSKFITPEFVVIKKPESHWYKIIKKLLVIDKLTNVIDIGYYKYFNIYNNLKTADNFEKFYEKVEKDLFDN